MLCNALADEQANALWEVRGGQAELGPSKAAQWYCHSSTTLSFVRIEAASG